MQMWQTSFRARNVTGTFEKRVPGPSELVQKTSGIVTGEALVSYWAILFPCPQLQSQKQLIITKLVSKCAQGMNQQLLKMSGAGVLSSGKKLRKTLGGWHPHPPPPLPVRPRVYYRYNEFRLTKRSRQHML